MYAQPAPVNITDIGEQFDDDQQTEAQKRIEKIRGKARREAQQELDAEETQLRRIVPVYGNTVTIARTRWLWRDRMPIGGLSIVAGKGDVSKSTLFACFTAWITTGDMKGEYYGEPRNVLYVVNEDSINHTVAPRMIAHGADMTRVLFVKVQSPLGEDALFLPRDANLLRDTIRQTGAVATFIDPLSANVTGRANDSREMRATFQEVNRIAEDTGSSIIGLAHTRKAGASDVIEAILGSTEQANVARSVHGLVMDPEEDGARLLSCEKLNLAEKRQLATLRFTVVSHNVKCTDGTGDWTPMPQIEWLPETTDTASDILTDAMNGNAGVDECARWLRKYVMDSGGEAYASDIRATPEGKRFSESMLVRGRRRAGVKTRRAQETHARTIWYIPGYGTDGTPPIHTQG